MSFNRYACCAAWTKLVFSVAWKPFPFACPLVLAWPFIWPGSSMLVREWGGILALVMLPALSGSEAVMWCG